MLRAAILLVALFSLGSCDYLESLFEVSVVKAMREAHWNLTNKGIVQNCGSKTESTFILTWDPEPVVKGQPVTVEGSVTFSEDFVDGEVSIDTEYGVFPYPLKCTDLGVTSCKKGEKITIKPKQIPVPKVIPIPISRLEVTARLKNKAGGREILCAKADIHIQQ